MSIKAVSQDEVDKMFSDKQRLQNKKMELESFLKRVKNNPDILSKLCKITIVDGHHLTPVCCAPIEQQLLVKIMNDFVEMLLKGMRISSKPYGWHVGFLGSRWLDMDAEQYGLDYVRCNFYSATTFGDPSKFPGNFSYAIQIIAEIGKDD